MAKPGNRSKQGTFLPGISGNPNGRPKENQQIKQLAREHTQAAMSTLVEALGDTSGSVRIAAANSILDRGWGKPSQDLVVQRQEQQELESMSDEQLLAIVLGRDKAQAEAGPS
jgi:hypothetical protein